MVAILFFLLFSFQFGYFAIFEALWNGQTPGKRWTHLRVIKDSGRPISAYDAILRNLIRIVDYLPTFYATGVITMLISSENKRVGDYAAGTVVIHEKPLQGVSSIWQHPAAPAQPVAAGPLPQLTVDELQLVEAFLNRRSSLEPDVRRAMARQIADSLGHRGVFPPKPARMRRSSSKPRPTIGATPLAFDNGGALVLQTGRAAHCLTYKHRNMSDSEAA